MGIRKTQAAMAALVAGLSAVGARAAPLEAYGKLPSIEDVRLSPDGQRLAFVGASLDDRVITITTIGGTQPAIVLKTGRLKLRGLEWADNGHLIITTSVTSVAPFGVMAPTHEYLQASLFNIATGRAAPIEPSKETGAINAVLAEPAVRTVNGRKTIFYKSNTPREHRGSVTLFSEDVATGQVRELDQGSLTERDFMVGAAGGEVARSFLVEGHWTMEVKTASGWRGAAPGTAFDIPSFQGLGPTGDTALVANARDEDGTRGLRQISLKDGSWLPDELHGRAIHDPQTGLTLAIRVNTDHSTYRFMDPTLQKSWDAILKAFPGEQVDFVSASDDRRKFVVLVFGKTTGAAFMLVDLTTGHADLIGDLYKDAPPSEVAITTPFAYAASDGLRIPAYLTLPKGAEAKNLPLIVLPHDGVAARDTLAFNWWVQALASRGYAVLQPQFRGSDGFSDSFRNQGFGQWGRKMQTDLSDGVRALAAKGTIDPKRVCIVGQGYGGYAALQGAALELGVYRCAVSVGGISDLKQMLDFEVQQHGGNSTAVPFFERYMGAESQHDPGLVEISPARQAAKIAIPVLLIHGKDDTIVPFQQSQAMANALNKALAPTELVALKGEDHWLSRADTRLQTLQATVRFLETYNPPDAAAGR